MNLGDIELQKRPSLTLIQDYVRLI